MYQLKCFTAKQLNNDSFQPSECMTLLERKKKGLPTEGEKTRVTGGKAGPKVGQTDRKHCSIYPAGWWHYACTGPPPSLKEGKRQSV